MDGSDNDPETGAAGTESDTTEPGGPDTGADTAGIDVVPTEAPDGGAETGGADTGACSATPPLGRDSGA
jgi:hypothetical protein